MEHYDSKDEVSGFFFENLAQIEPLFSCFEVEEIFVNELVAFEQLFEVLNWLVAHAKNAKLTTAIHDFFFACPQIHLLYKGEEFCGVCKEENRCNECLKSLDSRFNDIAKFRRRLGEFLAAVEEILYFSASSKELLGRVFELDERKLRFAPHKVSWIQKAAKASQNGKLKVAFLGHLTPHKGAKIVRELLGLCNKSPYEFFVFGKSDLDGEFENLTVCGAYDKQRLVELTNAYDIDIFIIASVTPETFSYTTQEAILLDKPVVCFDLGAQAEKVRGFEKGVVAKSVCAAALKEELDEFWLKTRG